MSPQEKVTDLIASHYKKLNQPRFELNRRALLMAIAANESSMGVDVFPRLEPAYDLGGYYFKRSYLLRKQYERFGDQVARSYGPFQVMYLVAVELGFNTDRAPAELADFETNLEMAIKYLNRRAIPHADKIEDLFDAYNSGSSRDANVPEHYIQMGMGRYEAFCEAFPEE